ncbi:Bug family tripartite tricarboxylate transporter substrate binding protein [Falsiroseomonas oryziterrae]|uniref:Bug family tripartite tricarboxylate transporter substrate binding protein n=1 Tax=Falsiroseomonas oryziterrae TaxID=2911368 RepID=UPI001F257673|nr:tripartite tricarboxylate transporter substrate binding protein [Roseomonas sp. NPKOSM-4]
MKRRTLLAASALALPLPALAQAFPTKPIRLVVPWAPGGATSNIARIVGDAMTPHLGQPVVLDHRAGAGGAIGSENVAKSPADGYSILIAGAGTFFRPVIERDVPFDPARDFGFVGPVGDGPFALVTRSGLPDTLPGFIAAARARPGAFNMASSGQGSTSHLAGEAFNAAAGISATHVPYRGAAPAMADLVGGRVDYYFDAFSTVLENARAGRIGLLGVTTPVRAPQAPDVPTLIEAGLPGFSIAPWWGLIGPAGMPEGAVARMSAALERALAQPAVVEALAAQGCRSFFLNPAAFADYVRAEDVKWVRVIEQAGLRVR